MIELQNKEALKFLEEFEDGTVDFIMTDPPYNIEKDYENYDDDREDYWSWQQEMLEEYYRVLKNDSAVAIVTPNSQRREWINAIDNSSFEEMPGSPVYWCRKNFAGGPRNSRGFIPSVYIIYILEKGENELESELPANISFTSQNYIEAVAPQSDFNGEMERVHPAQQPVPVYEKLILKNCPENGLVLDPFLGSGTAAVASKKWGRDFIGCDISMEYIQKAEKRIEKIDKMDRQVTLKND